MAIDPTIEQAIIDNLTGPAATSDQAGSMTMHDPEKQLAVGKKLAQEDASARPARGLRFTKLNPGGTT